MHCALLFLVAARALLLMCWERGKVSGDNKGYYRTGRVDETTCCPLFSLNMEDETGFDSLEFGFQARHFAG